VRPQKRFRPEPLNRESKALLQVLGSMPLANANRLLKNLLDPTWKNENIEYQNMEEAKRLFYKSDKTFTCSREELLRHFTSLFLKRLT